VYAYHKTGVVLSGTTSVDRCVSASGRGILPLSSTACLSPTPNNRDAIYAFGEERVLSCLQNRADARIPIGLSRVGWSPIAGFPSPTRLLADGDLRGRGLVLGEIGIAINFSGVVAARHSKRTFPEWESLPRQERYHCFVRGWSLGFALVG
jgi:hypothetical protein